MLTAVTRWRLLIAQEHAAVFEAVLQAAHAAAGAGAVGAVANGVPRVGMPPRMVRAGWKSVRAAIRAPVGKKCKHLSFFLHFDVGILLDIHLLCLSACLPACLPACLLLLLLAGAVATLTVVTMIRVVSCLWIGDPSLCHKVSSHFSRYFQTGGLVLKEKLKMYSIPLGAIIACLRNFYWKGGFLIVNLDH
jgi:hypothetical protein